MEIVLLTIGKTTTKYLQTGIDEYVKRLARYVPFRFVTLPDIKNARKLTEGQQKTAEGEQILQFAGTSDRLILLDEHGKEYTSMQFATELQKQMASGIKRLVFCIGGPYGFSEAVYQRSNGKISFSRMTFSHEMIRLFAVEQLYRGMTILRGEPYHHE